MAVGAKAGAYIKTTLGDCRANHANIVHFLRRELDTPGAANRADSQHGMAYQSDRLCQKLVAESP